jgi:hypothetical protein
MNNQKISTGIGTIIIVIIAITVGMFVWKNSKKIFTNLNSQTLLQSNREDDLKKENNIEISDKWTLVSHYNFWNNPNVFLRSAYNFPNIKFSYPENWEFKCCGDMDYGSEHFINLSKNHDKSMPYIRITDYILSGCTNSKNDCPIDKTVKLTANEKFNRLISSVASDKILPKLELKKLNTNAFVYNKTERDNKSSKAYMINLGNDVIQVDFINYELLDDKFIKNFLNRISFENKTEGVSFCGKKYETDQILIDGMDISRIIAKIAEKEAWICENLESGKFQESGITITQKKEESEKKSYLVNFSHKGNESEEKDPFNKSPFIFKFNFQDNAIFYQNQFDGSFKSLGTIR